MDMTKLLTVFAEAGTEFNARLLFCLNAEECDQLFALCKKAQKRYKKIYGNKKEETK